MRGYRTPFVIGALLGLAGCVHAQASISVGDEVVFSGGPSQKPRSIQTGFTLETGSMRLSGSDAAQARMRDREAKRAAKTEAAAAAATAGDGGAGDASATVASDGKAPLNLGGLSADELGGRVGDPDPLVRVAVASALGSTTAPAERASARRTLEELLVDADPLVTQSSLRALASFGDPTAGPLAMRLVYDSNDQTALAAIQAVQALDYRSGVPELTKLADRDTGAVGRAARNAVAELSKPPKPAPSAAPLLTPARP